MSDQETIPAAEPEVPADETVEEAETHEDTAPDETDVADDADADPEADPDAEGEEEDEDPDTGMIELKIGGETLQIKKGEVSEEAIAKVQSFVDGAERSYTRKFQEVSELRKEVESRREQVDRLATLNDEIVNEFADGRALQKQLNQLQQIDLQTLWQRDPNRARQISDQITSTTQQLQRVAQSVGQKEAALLQQQEAAKQQAIEAGRQRAERLSPGFTKEADKVIEYAVKEYGIDPDEAANWALSPETAVMARKAMLYDQMRASAKKPPARKAPENVKPVKSVQGGGRAKASSNPDKMSTEQWMKARAAGKI